MNERSEIVDRSTEKLSHDQLDTLGKFADTCENLIAASALPMKDEFHLKMLKMGLANLSQDIKALYIEVSGGENPWE